ncbi:MAG: HDOD domain-containing protein [Desulfococcaceae bacterium]|jgi:EAL and modified HD-GYP domain-containing signal transduction protein|nr:HDOD domain-containing protein [Desulfococcaceae bacterium]
MEVFLARQPIFSTEKKRFAYELLFRDSMENFMPDVNGEMATAKVLSTSFFTIGLEKVTGGKKAFINFTQKQLESEIPLLFPKELLVVEILEDVRPDPHIIRACQHISRMGYTIALDDFVFYPGLEPLMEITDIIKIDFMQTSFREIEEIIAKLPHPNIRLLAEKVETLEVFDWAKEMGFMYFQGYFFCKPEILKGDEIPLSNVGMLRIMAEVNRPDCNFDEIVSMVQTDISISYKLLRYVNSAFFRRAKAIDSIRQAVVLLGQNEMKKFLSLVIISAVAPEKPDELIRSACITAICCEKTARLARYRFPEELYTLGLFSKIDAILDRPMDKIIVSIPLSEKIRSALSGKSNEIRNYLDLWLHYEKGDWDRVQQICAELKLPEENIPAVYFEACEWADMLIR